LDVYAFLLLDMDEFEKAKELLQKSISLYPEGNPTKYLSFAQLLEGVEAVKMFVRGVELLTKQKEVLEKRKRRSEEQEEELQTLKQQISAGYCFAAEIYFTDSCFEEDAEIQCQRLLDYAVKADPHNPEPLSTLASLRLSQQKPQEAIKFLKQGYSLWKDADYEAKPSLEFRHNTAKLFMELEQHRIATDIWEDLIEEDDNIAEIFYHLALAYRPLSTTSATDSAKHARELLNRAKCDDPALVKLVDELLKALSKENVETLKSEQEANGEAGSSDEEIDDDSGAQERGNKMEIDDDDDDENT